MSSIQSVLSDKELKEANITIKNYKTLTCDHISTPATGMLTKARPSRPESYVKNVPDYQLLKKENSPYATFKFANRERLNSDLDLNE